MVTGVELDFVVKDCIAALETYERIFDVQRIEVTAFEKGSSEAVFSLYNTRIHMLDENPAYQLLAPKAGDPRTMWVNVMVPDIRATWKKAMGEGCTAVQPVTDMPDFGVINAMFTDPFGYLWMLHQVEREVCFEERCRILAQSQDTDGESR